MKFRSNTTNRPRFGAAEARVKGNTIADFHISVSYVPEVSRRALCSLRQDGLVLASLLQQRDGSDCWLPPELRVFDCLFQSEQIEGAKQALIELFDIQVKWAGEIGKPAKDSEEPK